MNLDYQSCRKISGLLFLTGNISLFLFNLYNTNWYQLIAGLLFVTCSISLILSAKNHRWLFYGGATVIAGYTLTSISTSGSGSILQYMGGIAGFIGGSLIIRAAYQRETGRQFRLPYLLSIIDKYPLASAGFIEGLCCLLTTAGSFMNHDIRLGLVSIVWFFGHGFLAASDEFVRAKFSK